MVENKLEKIVGTNNYSSEVETLVEYSEDKSFVSGKTPKSVVKPENSEEVQKIIRLANEEDIFLVPVSSGKPRFRGDTVPENSEAVIVNLSEMTEIRMIDRLDRVAMIEPGVKFSELQEKLEEEGLKLPSPLSPKKSKSIIGSFLEREPHIIPKYHLDHSEPLLCNEVVFGTGDLFRTGEAGTLGTIEEQWEAGRRQKNPEGQQININRLLQGAQGTLGIVTWSTVRCEILPQIQKPYFSYSDKLEDLLEFAYRLIRRKLGDEILILNKQNFSKLSGYDKEEMEETQDSSPNWVLFFCIGGYEYRPEERIEYQEKDIKEISEELEVPLSESVFNIESEEFLETVSTPSEEPYWKIRHFGGCQDIYFISPRTRIPKLMTTMKEIIDEKSFDPHKLGVYIQPVCQGHGYHCEFNLFYDSEDPEEVEKTKEVYLTACQELLEEGAFFSRPYDLVSEMVYDKCSSSRKALDKVKEIFDPNRVLNPGKLCFEV